MATHGDYSPEARDRAKRTVTAAGVFARHADHIVAAADIVAEGHVLVAVVSSDHELTGTHHVEQTAIVEQVPVLEEGGWAMVFSPGTTVSDVRRRTDEMAATAAKRALLIERLISRNQTA
ncbi:MAG: hypothetical protein ACTHMS_10950 [Jatrophihabitans sp.]|uniref:hypothetical protein n=1 Tax=Jatrophihabitans sp. TaxID=1932789 RepID=UPI003F7E2390